MANKHDARPFVDLQKDADEFRAKFEEDIEKCKEILDAKITALICDPDSVGNKIGLKQNALVEFSKAKYDIYVSMKSLMNEMEREWLKYISEMKKLFIDNVEVFLANTKLEVKFPSSGSSISSGPKKSFGSKSTEITSSIYPIISNITRSIPGLTQRKKSLDCRMEKIEVASHYDNLKPEKNPSPLKHSILHEPMNTSDLSENEESDESKQFLSELSSHPIRKGRFTDQVGNIYELSHVSTRKSNRSTSRSRSATLFEERTNNSDESEDALEKETDNNIRMSLKAPKGKQASKTQAHTKKIYTKVESSSESQGEASEESELIHANSRKFNRSTSRFRDADKTARPPGRPSRRKTMNEIAVERDEQTSISQPSRSVTRRKTLLPNVKEIESGYDLMPGNHTSTRSKRKTIIGVSDLASEVPAKRLKNSNIRKANNSESEYGVTDVNLLENDSYSEWISLKSIDSKIPTSPGIYEVKVWRAKKTAYIGSCDNLRQKLTLHKSKQNSGHKHLDKFIERNYDDIQIRYEVVSSVNDAKLEVKNRVNSFVSQHKTTPAYN